MTSTSLHLDNQLIQSFKGGSPQALESLINKYGDKIYSSIRCLVSDSVTADDIFRRVFISIIDKIRNRQYDEECTFLTTAIRIAYSLCVTHQREEDSHKSESKAAANSHDINGNFGETTPITELIYKQDSVDVIERLERLTDAQKEVIVLRQFGELSFRQIATLTKSTESTILLRMKQGLVNMNKRVAENALCS